MKIFERILTMRFLIVLIIPIMFFSIFAFPYIFRASTRTRADEIIYGHGPITEKSIKRCISFLTWTNNWITERTEQDQKRIDRLNLMLKEMQNPHG